MGWGLEPTRMKSLTSALVEGCGSLSGSEQDKVPREAAVSGVWELVRAEGTPDHNVSVIAELPGRRSTRWQTPPRNGPPNPLGLEQLT